MSDDEVRHDLNITAENENSYYQAVDKLVNRGWLQVQIEEGFSVYFLHVVIQEILMKRLDYKDIDFDDVTKKYRDKSMFQKMLITAKKVLHIRKSENPKIYRKISESHNDVSIAFRSLNEFEKAILHKEESIRIWEENEQEDKNYANLCNSASSLYIDVGRIEDAMYYVNKGLEVRIRIFGLESDEVAGSYNNLSVILKKKNDFSHSLEYAFQALKIAEVNKRKDTLVFSYNNIGETFKLMKKFEKALEYLHLAESTLPLSSLSQRKDFFAKTYEHLSDCYYQKSEKDWEKALEYRKKAILKWREIPHSNSRKAILSIQELLQFATQEKGEEWVVPYYKWLQAEFTECLS